MYVKRIEELMIYQISIQFAQDIFELTENISHHWQVVEVNQIRRSSSSVPSNIAEGFGQRFYPKKFMHYLNIAKGSSDETQNHLRLLCRKEYITENQMNSYMKININLSVRILNFIVYLKRKHDIYL